MRKAADKPNKWMDAYRIIIVNVDTRWRSKWNVQVHYHFIICLISFLCFIFALVRSFLKLKAIFTQHILKGKLGFCCAFQISMWIIGLRVRVCHLYTQQLKLFPPRILPKYFLHTCFRISLVLIGIIFIFIYNG